MVHLHSRHLREKKKERAVKNGVVGTNDAHLLVLMPLSVSSALKYSLNLMILF